MVWLECMFVFTFQTLSRIKKTINISAFIDACKSLKVPEEEVNQIFKEPQKRPKICIIIIMVAYSHDQGDAYHRYNVGSL